MTATASRASCGTRTFTSRDSLLLRWERVLRDGAESLGPDTPAGARLADTQAFFEFVHAELEALMVRWRAQRGAMP